MPNEMIERVAKTLMLSKYPNDRWDNRGPKDVARLDHLMMARAAIQAMREPTNEMYNNYKCDKQWKDLNSIEVWKLWIDAALKE